MLTLVSLWKLWNDPEGCSIDDFGLHFVSRAWGLLMVPFFTYMAIFGIEFWMLNRHSPDANGMSVGFQMALKGYPGNFETFQRVSYGSLVRFKSSRFNEMFLHSHSHAYPYGGSGVSIVGKEKKQMKESSGNQQVTGYSFRDRNNEWIIRKSPGLSKGGDQGERTSLDWLKQNDLIRLEHMATGKFLRVNEDTLAPVSVEELEVSAHGHRPSNISDKNDLWRIHVVYSADSTYEYPIDESQTDPLKRYKPIHARETFIRLEHVESGCYLATHGKKLPRWAFQHKEILCAKNAKFKNSVWEIDSNKHSKC